MSKVNRVLCEAHIRHAKQQREAAFQAWCARTGQPVTWQTRARWRLRFKRLRREQRRIQTERIER